MNVRRNIDTDKWAYIFYPKHETESFFLKKLATNKGSEINFK